MNPKLLYSAFILFPSLALAQVTDSAAVNIKSVEKKIIQQDKDFKVPIKQEKRNDIKIDEIRKKEQTDQNKVLVPTAADVITAPMPEEIQQPFQSPLMAAPDEIVLESLMVSFSLSEAEVEFDNGKKRLKGPSQFDSRIEMLQLDSAIDWQLEILTASESVAMVVEKEKLSQISKNVYTLDISQSLGKTYNLCPTEAFFNQPVVGTGTAFIFSNNTMLTAKHVFEKPLKDYVIVFGYRIIHANGVVENFYNANDLYYPREIISNLDDMDVIQFKVDREFDRPALKWANSATLVKNDEVYMIGYPMGIPQKISLNANIEDNSKSSYFYTSLDSFQGNSGSPVFDFTTNKVIGILVSGEIDFKFNGNCFYCPICKVPYCKGEKVMRIEEIVNQL